MTQSDFEKLAEEVQKLKKRRKKIDNALEVKIPILKANCSHKKTAIREWHCEGSYLDKSETHEVTYCVVCNTELNDKVSYGWYA